MTQVEAARPLPPRFAGPSWEDCFRLGMTVHQAAAARGQDKANGYAWASKRDLKWPPIPGHIDYHGPRKPAADLPPLPPIVPDQLDIRACRELWAEVLLGLWRDVFPEDRVATRHPTYEGARRAQIAAQWFGSKDFFMVCALAGFDGSAVMDRFRARMGSRGMTL